MEIKFSDYEAVHQVTVEGVSRTSMRKVSTVAREFVKKEEVCFQCCHFASQDLKNVPRRSYCHLAVCLRCNKCSGVQRGSGSGPGHPYQNGIYLLFSQPIALKNSNLRYK